MAEDWLRRSHELVPVALEKARNVKRFPSRWKMIVSKLEQIPSRLSDLSTHPFFSKNALCKEQLQAVWETLNEAIELAEMCASEKCEGKLRMQSDLDVLSGKLDLNLRDCGVLIKTRVLGEVTMPNINLRELLARLQIGHSEDKHRALDALLRVMKDDEKNILEVLGRSNISALIQLLTASSPQIREKSVTIICWLAESGSFENWLLLENVLPPLIRLLESSSALDKEKAAISLQRFSASTETARLIVGHGGIRPLIEICQTADDPVSLAAAACTLKNISVLPEARRTLSEEGIIRVMINLLDCGNSELKEYSAQCLQNISSGDEELRRCVIEEGGIQSLIAYLDGSLPQEFAIGALANLVGYASTEKLVSIGLLPRLVHVLKSGSINARVLAASAVCRISTSVDTKKLAGESGCIPVLIKLLEAKDNGLREVCAQAISSLMTLGQNCRQVKKDHNSVPNLVQLLDPSPHNTAKKYAASCLVLLSSSKKCKKLMISHGAIGYLKKLCEMDVPGAKKLLERLERGQFISLSLFNR